MNRRHEETTAGAPERFGSAFAAYRSLARSRNVSLATVIDAAEKGDLTRIVDMRDFGAQRKIEERNLARLEYLNRLRVLETLRDPL